MTSQGTEELPLIRAGFACAELIADPQTWINRRVETVEMLSHEETRRRVSIDFTLSDEQLEALTINDGIVVPISVLSKERRRNFDLRDESGRSVPVLGRGQNGDLAHIALVGAAVEALPSLPSEDALEVIAADLRRVVSADSEDAENALGFLLGSADAGDELRQAIVVDPTCASILNTLWANYVLFAVLPKGGANRRVLKYSYGEGFSFATDWMSWRDRLWPARWLHKLWKPDRRAFIVECPGAWRAASFHAEIAIPEELRVEYAVLWDVNTEVALGDADTNVDRASLYANGINEGHSAVVFAEVAPERGGSTTQAALTSATIAGLLWLGVASGLDATTPGPAVSILMAGVALFSGLAAVQGRHRLVKRIFRRTRLWLIVVTLVALTASALLALEMPSPHPVAQWRAAAVVASWATLDLVWSAIRAPGYGHTPKG